MHNVRKLAISTLALGALCLGVSAASAAPKTPRVSPAASVSQDVGITTVKIDYHRPGVKGRKIWGDLVPYDKVWRLGANNATKITFSDAVTIGGTSVPAGTYALFAIPGATQWTFVINKEAEQWGAFSHKPDQDVAKVTATPRAGADTEWMQLTIEPLGEGKASVEFSWEKVRVSFPIETDTRKAVWKSIDDSLKTNPKDPDTLLVAARYAAETGERVDEALAWVDTGVAAKETFWFYDTKAALLVKAGRGKEAAPLLAKILEMAPGARMPQEYLDGIKKRQAALATIR